MFGEYKCFSNVYTVRKEITDFFNNIFLYNQYRYTGTSFLLVYETLTRSMITTLKKFCF